MMSYRQPLTQWTLAELGHEIEEAKYYEVIELSIPQKNHDVSLLPATHLMSVLKVSRDESPKLRVRSSRVQL
jgi:hypothetical protein